MSILSMRFLAFSESIFQLNIFVLDLHPTVFFTSFYRFFNFPGAVSVINFSIHFFSFFRECILVRLISGCFPNFHWFLDFSGTFFRENFFHTIFFAFFREYIIVELFRKNLLQNFFQFYIDFSFLFREYIFISFFSSISPLRKHFLNTFSQSFSPATENIFLLASVSERILFYEISFTDTFYFSFSLRIPFIWPSFRFSGEHLPQTPFSWAFLQVHLFQLLWNFRFFSEIKFCWLAFQY